MKLFLAITLIFSVSLIQAKDFPWKKVERKKPKIIKTNTERFLKNPEFKETPTDWIKSKKVKKGKRLELFKKKRSSFQANTTYKQGTSKGHLKPKDGDIQITEVPNGKENEVTIQISDPKGKYFVERVRYRIPGVLKELEAATSLNDGVTTADLDVSNVPFGVHTLKFEFISKKIKKQDKGKGHKKGHTKVFLGEATFEKKQLLFALFSVEHDANSPVVTLDAQESYSNSSQISEYTFKIYSDNELLESFSQTEPRLIHSFKEPGVYELSIVVKDGSGNFAESERQSVEITNSAPTLVYEMDSREGLPGHYNIDFTGSHDKDGQNIKYYRLLIHYDDNGETIYQGDLVWTVPTINFAAPESGRDYTLTIVVYDEDLNYTYEEVSFRYDGPIAPKYAWHYISDDDVMPHVKYIGAEFLDVDPIKSYHYKATHEDGTVVYPWDDSTVQHTGIELVKPGKWTFEFYGIDSTGLKSDVGRETVEILWEPSDLTPIIEGYYSAPSEADPRVWYVGANFTDPLGEVVKYEFKATHSSGTVVYEERSNEANNELRFPIKGEWTIEVTATDNDGFTGSFSWTEDVQWDFDKAFAELTFEQDSANPYAFFVTSVNSSPSIVKTYVSAAHESGKSVNAEHAGEPNFWIDLYERGNWTIEYRVEDAFGLVSETATTTLNIEPIVLNINIAQDPEVARQYILDPSGSYDPLNSLTNIDYKIVATHESGEKIEFTHYEGMFNFELSTPGNWKVEVYGVDSAHGVESGYYSERIEVINQLPIVGFALSKGNMWNEIVLDASSSVDPDGEVSKFEYKLIHEGGYTQNFSTENPVENLFLEELKGQWHLELVVVDSDGGRSAPHFQDFEVKDELPVANFYAYQSGLWNEFTFNAMGSYDLDGYIVNYTYKLIHSSGAKTEISTSNQIQTFVFEQEGTWEVSLEVMDNGGNVSEPYIAYVYPDNPNNRPVADLVCKDLGNLVVSCDASRSYDSDGSVLKYVYEIGGKVYDTDLDSIAVKMDGAGTKTVSLKVIDNLDAISSEVVSTVDLVAPKAPVFEIECAYNSVLKKNKCYVLNEEYYGSIPSNYSWKIDGISFRENNSVIYFTPQLVESNHIELSITFDSGDSLTATYELRNDLEFLQTISFSEIFISNKTDGFHPINEKLQVEILDNSFSSDELIVSVNDVLVDLEEPMARPGPSLVLIDHLYLKEGFNEVEVRGKDSQGRSIYFVEQIVAGGSVVSLDFPQSLENGKLRVVYFEKEKRKEVDLSVASQVTAIPRQNIFFLLHKDDELGFKFQRELSTAQTVSLESVTYTENRNPNYDFSSNLEGWTKDKANIVLDSQGGALEMRPLSNGELFTQHTFSGVESSFLRTNFDLVTQNSNDFYFNYARNKATGELNFVYGTTYPEEVYAGQSAPVPFDGLSVESRGKGNVLDIGVYYDIEGEVVARGNILNLFKNAYANFDSFLKFYTVAETTVNISNGMMWLREDGVEMTTFATGSYYETGGLASGESLPLNPTLFKGELKGANQFKVPLTFRAIIKDASSIKVETFKNETVNLFSLAAFESPQGGYSLLDPSKLDVKFKPNTRCSEFWDDQTSNVTLDCSGILNIKIVNSFEVGERRELYLSILDRKGSELYKRKIFPTTRYLDVPYLKRNDSEKEDSLRSEHSRIQGGHFWVNTSLYDKLSTVLSLGGFNGRPIINDISRMNGGVWESDHSVGHKNGGEVDINFWFYDPADGVDKKFHVGRDNQNNINYFAGKMIAEHIEQNYHNIEQIFLNWPSSTSEAFNPFQAALEMTCLPDGRSVYSDVGVVNRSDKSSYPGVIKKDEANAGTKFGHDDHLHISYFGRQKVWNDYNMHFCFKVLDSFKSEDGSKNVKFDIYPCGEDYDSLGIPEGSLGDPIKVFYKKFANTFDSNYEDLRERDFWEPLVRSSDGSFLVKVSDFSELTLIHSNFTHRKGSCGEAGGCEGIRVGCRKQVASFGAFLHSFDNLNLIKDQELRLERVEDQRNSNANFLQNSTPGKSARAILVNSVVDESSGAGSALVIDSFLTESSLFSQATMKGSDLKNSTLLAYNVLDATGKDVLLRNWLDKRVLSGSACVDFGEITNKSIENRYTTLNQTDFSEIGPSKGCDNWTTGRDPVPSQCERRYREFDCWDFNDEESSYIYDIISNELTKR